MRTFLHGWNRTFLRRSYTRTSDNMYYGDSSRDRSGEEDAPDAKGRRRHFLVSLTRANGCSLPVSSPSMCHRHASAPLMSLKVQGAWSPCEGITTGPSHGAAPKWPRSSTARGRKNGLTRANGCGRLWVTKALV